MSKLNERYQPIKRFAVRQAARTPDVSEWWVVRALIPDAWFTKRGPGILAEAKKVWKRFTLSQRLVAVDRGWFPSGGPRG